MANIQTTIIDYKMGNLFSLKCALDFLGFKNKISNNVRDIKNSQVIFIPGVGAFKQAMENLKKLKIYDYILEHNFYEKDIVGICLGMQILFKEGVEGQRTKGLGFLNGTVNKIRSKNERLLNVGWSELKIKKKNIFNKINKRKKFYFIHSYAAIPEDKKIISSFSDFQGKKFCASIEKKNIYGFQFHPEKSSLQGIQLLKNLKESIYEKYI